MIHRAHDSSCNRTNSPPPGTDDANLTEWVKHVNALALGLGGASFANACIDGEGANCVRGTLDAPDAFMRGTPTSATKGAWYKHVGRSLKPQRESLITLEVTVAIAKGEPLS